MKMYELEVGWAISAAELRYLHWELLACDEVRGVFRTTRDGVLAVLFDGGPGAFRNWASGIAPRAAA
jgi:hypothetical protein